MPDVAPLRRTPPQGGPLDGKTLLEAEDTTFPDAGMIGLWTKADAQSYFDDLTVAE